MKLRTILPLTIAFLSGIYADRISFHLLSPVRELSAPVIAIREKIQNTPDHSLKSTLSADVPTRSSRSSDSPVKMVLKEPRPVAIELPKMERSPLAPEKERDFLDLVKSELPQFIQTSPKHNPDGSVDIYSKTEDGKDIYRHFNPRGELTREGWNNPNTTENFSRTFYESGEVKMVSWTQADRTISTINFNQYGLFEARYDRIGNDTSYYNTTYDDAGQVKDLWRTDKNGKHTKIQ